MSDGWLAGLALLGIAALVALVYWILFWIHRGE